MVPVETSNQSIVPRSADDVIGAVPSSINDNNTDKDDNPDSKRQYVHLEASYMLSSCHNFKLTFMLIGLSL